jgi:integrase
LKRLQLRHRRAYQTRSTYCTMNLMVDNPNPAWIARQAGHSLRVFWESYARWINQADNGREVAKLDAELARRKGERK